MKLGAKIIPLIAVLIVPTWVAVVVYAIYYLPDEAVFALMAAPFISILMVCVYSLVRSVMEEGW